MSSAPAAHGNDAHDDHAFTGEPIQVLPADEPRTPGWLPLLGVALFTAAAVIFLAGRGAAPEAPAAAGALTAAAGAPAAPVVVRPERPRPGPPGTMGNPQRVPQTPPMPGAAPSMRPVTPEQRQQLIQNLGQAKAAQPPPAARPH
jgi:hypothetical protein